MSSLSEALHIYRRPFEWGSGTDLVEVGPGRYDQKHWQPGFIFVREEGFVVASGILKRHFPTYDPYDVQDIERAVATKVIADWRHAARHLHECTPPEVLQMLGLTWRNDGAILRREAPGVSSFLEELAGTCARFLEQEEHFCVLGL